MSEDEKEAIKTVEDLKIMKWYSHAFDNGTEILTQEEKSDIDIVLNLIEKQQKELQQEKEKNKELIKRNEALSNNMLSLACNSIRKDKIREILEKYKYTEIGDTMKIIEFYKTMQGLLEEN